MSQNTDNEESFADLIGTVKKLDQQKINPYQQGIKTAIKKNHHKQSPPSSESLQEYDLAMNTDMTSAPETWFDSGLQKKLQKKIRQGGFSIDDHVDLHGFRLSEAGQQLNTFIKTAIFYQQKFVLIIHGKGLQSKRAPVIKPMVLTCLHHNQNVLGYCPAQIQHGGKGASYVYLR